MSAFGTKRTSLFAPHMSACGGKADITLRLCTVGFLFRLRHSGRFVPTDCFGTILVSFPDAPNDNVGDQTHDRGNDQRHQELAHGCGLLITEQRKPVLYVSLRGYWSDVRYWHLADMRQCTAYVRFRGKSGHDLLSPPAANALAIFS